MVPQGNPGLSTDQTTIAARAANEGVPIAAIARIIQQPFDLTSEVLGAALSLGQIGHMPRSDWPPNAPWTFRMPSVPRSANAEDVEFACRRVFGLTSLEAGFMMVLLRYECVDKVRLHNVVEQQRNSRALRPDSAEPTDPKMVDVMICKLRKKLREVDKKFIIVTQWGKGYYFVPEVKQAIFNLIGGPYACGPEIEREKNLACVA